jgi:hypothetical protein
VSVNARETRSQPNRPDLLRGDGPAFGGLLPNLQQRGYPSTTR